MPEHASRPFEHAVVAAAARSGHRLPRVRGCLMTQGYTSHPFEYAVVAATARSGHRIPRVRGFLMTQGYTSHPFGYAAVAAAARSGHRLTRVRENLMTQGCMFRHASHFFRVCQESGSLRAQVLPCLGELDGRVGHVSVLHQVQLRCCAKYHHPTCVAGLWRTYQPHRKATLPLVCGGFVERLVRYSAKLPCP